MVQQVADGLAMAVSLSDTDFSLKVGLGQVRLKSDWFDGWILGETMSSGRSPGK